MAQLTVQKQSQRLHRPFVLSVQCNKSHTNRKLDNQPLRRIVCSVSWESSFIVFQEWHCRCVAVCSVCVAQSSSTHSIQPGRNSWILLLCCSFQFLVSLVSTCPNTCFIFLYRFQSKHLFPLSQIQLSMHKLTQRYTQCLLALSFVSRRLHG